MKAFPKSQHQWSNIFTGKVFHISYIIMKLINKFINKIIVHSISSGYVAVISQIYHLKPALEKS